MSTMTCDATGKPCDCGPAINQSKRQAGSIKVDLSQGPKYICRCGQSKKFPYCDGSHKAYNEKNGTEFTPLKATKESVGKDVIGVCACGHSKNRKQGKPWCNGTHNKLVEARTEPGLFSGQMMVLSLLVAALGYLVSEHAPLESVTGPRVPKKMFQDFASFYPFYLREHSNMICRRLHLVGTSIISLIVLMNPKFVVCMLLSGCVGYLSNGLVAGLPDGKLEAAAMFGVYLLSTRMAGISGKKAAAIPLIGYAFAWVGHFYFELNKPATFTYPSFSLMGDYMMAFEMVTGKIAGFRELVPGMYA